MNDVDHTADPVLRAAARRTYDDTARSIAASAVVVESE